MIVPYAYLTYCPDNPAFGRWDQAWIARTLAGQEGPSTVGVRFTEDSPERVIANGGVLVFPAGHYREHGEQVRALRRLWDDLLRMPWGVLIATSDESASFEWCKIDPWPEHIRLWVQLPRVELNYTPLTMFYGEGSPTPAWEMPDAYPRDVDVFLAGQVNHQRRIECFDAVSQSQSRRTIVRTPGFTQGMSHGGYLEWMNRTIVAPAPAGIQSQSSFRAFEALEAGAVPIVDALRPDGSGRGYWDMLGLGWLRQCDDWSTVEDQIQQILADPHWEAARTSSLWQIYKRDVITRLNLDALAVSKGEPEPHPVTVVIPTSPIPSHPDPGIIIDTIRSVRERLPDAEILIGCDGIRPEQADRRDGYVVYLRRLCEWAARHPGITPFVFDSHRHQSGIMRALLPEIHTPYLMFVEHDTPLVGDIPFADIFAEMDRAGLNSMRFMHEAEIQEGHEHLFLDRHTDGAAPWQATIQWSARPHVARTSYYEHILERYFAPEACTFLEDLMHGVAQHGFAINTPYATRKHAERAWRRHRLAVYAPDGDMKRSGHLDGRGADPKYPVRFAYSGERPADAPPEGWYDS